ncbi:hypothetical protein HKX48_000338 [Thoreauomyces humboldtii]|nr:hypothetical protein HKX48_000338 [Thoreauomyces humboldtii]
MSSPRQLIKKLQAAGLQKRILPPKDLSTHGHNGSALTFVPQLTKLTLRYDHPRMGAGGSSAGLVAFLTTRLPLVASQRPYVEFCVRPANAVPPTLTARYACGRRVDVDVSRMKVDQVAREVAFLCDTRDGQETRVVRGSPVRADGTAGAGRGTRVGGVWDPFTADSTFTP